MPHLLSSNNIFDYFERLFVRGSWGRRIILMMFFSVSLIVPLLGEPSQSSAAQLESGLVFIFLNAVFLLMALMVFLANRSIGEPRLRNTGRAVLALVLIPILAFTTLTFLVAILGNEIAPVLRALASLVIVIPLSLIIAVLVESVIRRGVSSKSSGVPLVLVLVTIFLIMYTFATIYFINGLLVKQDVVNGVVEQSVLINFGDAFYFSGLIFTTLGTSNILPVGLGRGILLVESVTGYLVLGLLTAIFIQALISSRSD